MDTHVIQAQPDENHGSDTVMRAGSGATAAQAQRVLLLFDITKLGGCTVTAAELSIYCESEDFLDASPELEVRRITAPWSGTSVTWNLRASNMPWTTAGGDFAAAAVSTLVASGGWFGWLSWDVQSLVADWLAGTPNDGLELLERSDTTRLAGRKVFRSSESSPVETRPVLTVSCRQYQL